MKLIERLNQISIIKFSALKLKIIKLFIRKKKQQKIR